MDANAIIFWAIEALLAGLGLVLWSNLRDAKSTAEGNVKALADHKLHAAETYVTKSDLGKAMDTFNRSIDGVLTKLDRIEQKLDQKQDKS